jgi:gamma-glutamyltranspeptidase/glutathione hydrolase
MNAGWWRQSGLLAGLLMLALFVLAACGESATREDLDNPAGKSPGRGGLGLLSRGAFGGVIADEGKVAEAGRDVIAANGSAIDAAVAMFFAQAVSLPSAGSLGAAGVCIVHNNATRKSEIFAFPPVAAPGPIVGAPFLVPSGVRAITLMHIRHGRQRFEALVAPAERNARYGIPVSRALARDLQAAAPVLAADAEARRVFFRGGNVVGEGDTLVQPDLAGVLGSLRQTIGADFFQGRIARQMSDQISQMGGSLPLETIRATAPVTTAPLAQEYRGNFRVYTAPAPFSGAAATAAWNGQGDGSGMRGGDSMGFAGFIAIDPTGTAAGCSFSMGQLFGIRRMVPTTGIVLGAATADAASISPLLIANPGNGEFLFVGVGGGSPGAAGAVGAVARASIQGNEQVLRVLTARAGRGGTVNAIACPRGIGGDVQGCHGSADPAGFGLSLPATPAR